MAFKDKRPITQSVLYDDDGYVVGVILDDTIYRLQTEAKLRGKVSTDNTTVAPLGSGATFTGTSEDITDFAIAYVSVFSDVASAVDGLSIERSSDGTNWDLIDIFTVPANTGKTFSIQCDANFFRVRYTNDSSAQSIFRLQTIFKQVYGKPSSHRIADSIEDDDDAELVKSLITGQNADGYFINVAVDALGQLNVISNPGPAPPNVFSSIIHGEVEVGGPGVEAIRLTTYNEPTSEAQRSISSDDANDTSAGSGARTVQITYYTSALDERLTETITLSGTTPVNTSAIDIQYIESMEVLTAGSSGHNEGVITLHSSTGGGGSAIGTIAATRNLTFWAHHYVLDGKTLFLGSLSGGVEEKEPGIIFGRAQDLSISDSVNRQVTPSLTLAASATGANSLTSTYAVPIAVIDGPARFTLYVNASAAEVYFGGFAITEQ